MVFLLFAVINLFQCSFSVTEEELAGGNWIILNPEFPNILYEIKRDSYSMHFRVHGPADHWFGVALSKDWVMTDDDIGYIYKGDGRDAVVHRLGRHAKGYDLTDPQSRLVNSTFYNGVYTFHMQILVLHYQLWDFPNKEDDLRLLLAYGKGECICVSWTGSPCGAGDQELWIGKSV